MLSVLLETAWFRSALVKDLRQAGLDKTAARALVTSAHWQIFIRDGPGNCFEWCFQTPDGVVVRSRTTDDFR